MNASDPSTGETRGDPAAASIPLSRGDSAAGGRNPRLAQWILIVLGGIAVLAGIYYFDLPEFLGKVLLWVDRLGIWAPVLFILIYIVATVFLVPGSLLTLGAGVIFGVVYGSILASFAATFGATAAFLAGRYLARGWVRRKIATSSRFAAIDDAVAAEGWKIVALTRLSPIFPFVVLNYGFGLTRVRLKDYFWASWIGMLPGTVMYVYFGSLAGSLAVLAEKEQRERTAMEWVFYGFGMAATVVVTVYVTRLARRALRRRLATAAPNLPQVKP